MEHEEARRRVCAGCMSKITRRTTRKISLAENEAYLEQFCQIFPDFDVNNFWLPTILCDACATYLRKNSNSHTKQVPSMFKVGQKYLETQKRRSVRETATNEHRDCKLCETANPQFSRGCIKLPQQIPTQQQQSTSSSSKIEPLATVPISHKDLKRVQVENGLTQNQILGVLKSLRFATRGGLKPEAGFKEFLAKENRIFEDIFKVIMCTKVWCGSGYVLMGR